jgi:hypothetical protein
VGLERQLLGDDEPAGPDEDGQVLSRLHWLEEDPRPRRGGLFVFGLVRYPLEVLHDLALDDLAAFLFSERTELFNRQARSFGLLFV